MADKRETGLQLLQELTQTFDDSPILNVSSFLKQAAIDYNGTTHTQKSAINHLRRAIRPSWQDVFWNSLAALTQSSTTVYEYDFDSPFNTMQSEVLQAFPARVETYYLLVEQAAAEFLERSARNLKIKQVLLAGMGFVNTMFPNLPSPQIRNQAG